MLKNIFRLLMLSLFLSGNQTITAQISQYNLPSPNNIFYQSIFTNPAYFQKGYININTNFHTYTGAFSDVNVSTISISKNLKKDKSIGGKFLHENTSDFFTRSRIHFIYQKQLQLTPKTWLAAGSEIGAINFKMTALGGTTGGSDWSPDLGFGLHCYNPKYNIGLSVSQISKPSLTPMIFTFDLDIVYESFANYIFDISPWVKYKPELRSRVIGDRVFPSLSQTIEIQENFGLAFNYLHQQGYSTMGYYLIKNESKYNFDFFASYFFPINSLKSRSVEQFELGLNIRVKE